MNPTDANRILERARRAQSAWGELPVSRRCKLLARLRRTIALSCESIANTIALETSKPLLDALSGDVMVTLEMMRYYEKHGDKFLRSRSIAKPPFFFRGTQFETRFEPHGVALIFGPSNYPFQLSIVPMITALTAGNAVVLKISERTPATAALIAELYAEAGLPADLVQILHLESEDAAALIDAGPDIVFFTGSSRNGQVVAERAAGRLIPTIMELGGKDAALVFADCHLQRAVEGITYGAYANSGRVCVGIKRALVEESIYDEFLLRLRQRIAGLRIHAGSHADLHPLPEKDCGVLRAQIHDAITRGAILQWPLDGRSLARTPVLLTNVPSQSRLLAEESFGPVLCVAPFRDEAEALALANDTQFALSASVWTKDKQRAQRMASSLSCGSCAINDVIRVIANPHASFGGNRRSGYGRYHGPEGLRAFSRSKTVMMAPSRRHREINWFPFTEATSKQLAGLLRFRHGGGGVMSRLTRLLLALWLGIACFIPMTAQVPPSARLDVTVRLTPKARGELAYLVFHTASGFPGDATKAIRRDFLPIPLGADQIHLRLELPLGLYAISVYEDLNSNHKLDHNLLGIPREPVGASNNPPPRLGPPRFEDCSFHVGSASQSITISLVPGL